MPTICLSVFDHFSGLALKGLKISYDYIIEISTQSEIWYGLVSNGLNFLARLINSLQSQNEIWLANSIYPRNHGSLSICLGKMSFSTVWTNSEWFTDSNIRITSHLLTKVTKSSPTEMDAKVHHIPVSIIFWIQISLDTGNKHRPPFCSKCFVKYLVGIQLYVWRLKFFLQIIVNQYWL